MIFESKIILMNTGDIIVENLSQIKNIILLHGLPGFFRLENLMFYSYKEKFVITFDCIYFINLTCYRFLSLFLIGIARLLQQLCLTLF